MTANNRAENPDTHAKKRMANVIRLFHPAGFVSNVFILTLVSVGSNQMYMGCFPLRQIERAPRLPVSVHC